MSKCEVCGNDYDKSFEVVINGSRHTFDSFECAIHAVAPVCVHCGCKIMGMELKQAVQYSAAQAAQKCPELPN